MVVWLELTGSGGGDVYARRFSKSENQWGTAQNLSNSGRCWSETYMLCSVDVDDANRFTAAWTEQSAVKLRTWSGGQWGGVEQVGSGSGLDGARVAVTGGGDIFLVWWTGDGSVVSRARVGGSWEGTHGISEGGKRSKFPDIAVGNNQALACWMEKNGDLYQAVYVTRGRTFGSGWSSVRRVASASNPQQHPVAEYANGETPHVVFTPIFEPSRSVQHSFWTGGGFSTPQNISDTTMLHYPSLAEKSGALLAVWQVGSWGAGQAIYQNSYQGGRWTGQTAIPGSNGCTFADAALDGAGKSYIVWDASGEVYYFSGAGGVVIPNLAPVANFAFSPTTGLAPLTVAFDASASYDPDGTIAQYDWIFGDGDTAAGRTVSHVFQKKGTYAVKLTVVDDRGKSASAVKTVEVLGLEPPLGVAWQTFKDESLFLTRYVTDVTWARNPANDAIAAVTKYKIYRKKVDEDEGVYKACGEVDGSTFIWRDTKVAGLNQYVYVVTALDAAGHESPMAAVSTADGLDAEAKDKVRLGAVIKSGRGR
ncbi:MAG: PKD domain-containing protein [Candidatus Aminicenantes bacterium]|nr:PKD domain-containing protein [Candidatus Aminicenantes bacterium]